MSQRGSLGRHVQRKSAEVDTWDAHRQPAYAKRASTGHQSAGGARTSVRSAGRTSRESRRT